MKHIHIPIKKRKYIFTLTSKECNKRFYYWKAEASNIKIISDTIEYSIEDCIKAIKKFTKAERIKDYSINIPSYIK